MIPTRLFLTKGVGRHKERLLSLEFALREAGIERFNLIKVSSIYAPYCKIISKEEGLRDLKSGQLVHCVMSNLDTNENSRHIAASIGVAIPKDESQYGYLSEHHAYGQTDEIAGDYAEDLAATMLAATLGIDFDPNSSWDEREKFYKMSGKIVNTRNITQSAEGKPDELWTTVLAAAVFTTYNQ